MIVFKGDTEEQGASQHQGRAKASVWDGAFTTTVAPLDENLAYWLETVGDEVSRVSNNVQVTVTLNPKRESPEQKDEVIKAIGTNGENLASSPQKKVIGEKTVRRSNENTW